jgi:predicted acetyltransferase
MTPPAPPLPEVTLPGGYRLAVLGEEDRAAILDLDAWAFAAELPPDAAALLPFPLEPGRSVGVWADGPGGPAGPRLAALHSSYELADFPVPGAEVRAAGLTWVGVHPQHRRRGLARAMVVAHLARTAARGEVLSALFAAEPAIYGRFGYGCASWHTRLTLGRAPALRDVPGTADLEVVVESADVGRHSDVVSRVHADVDRPGWVRRATSALRDRAVIDVPSWRHGGESLRIAVVRRGEDPRGYALFRRKEHWDEHNSPAGTASVRESATLDGAAARVLWGALTDLDLMVSIETGILAVDDHLLHLLVDLRTARPRPTDNLWVRLVDVPAALAGRRYACDVDVVVEVADDLLPANAGRWRLRAGRADASVARTGDPADLSLDVAQLGAAYLGGTSLAALAGAGLVRERTPGALAAAATAFGWPVAPVCNFIF